jgi:hypothetical protein
VELESRALRHRSLIVCTVVAQPPAVKVGRIPTIGACDERSAAEPLRDTSAAEACSLAFRAAQTSTTAFVNDSVLPWCPQIEARSTMLASLQENDHVFAKRKNGAIVRRLVRYSPLRCRYCSLN